MERPMPAVKAIIERDGKLLALETEVDEKVHWVPPGGRVEYGEEPVEALEREVEEEISCEPDIGDPVGMYHFFIGPDNEGDQVVLTAFEVDIGEQEVDIGDNPADENITGLRWLEPKEFIEKTGNENLKRLIRDYSSDLPKLIRDRIPEIARENGDELETVRLDSAEAEEYLGQKLVEEAEEFRESEEIEELADVLEVVDALIDRKDVSWEEIERIQEQKKAERGGFEDGLLLQRSRIR